MFVSNSDNLGANLDLDILTHFAHSDTPFMMELCERTVTPCPQPNPTVSE